MPTVEITESYGVGAIVRNGDKLVDPFKNAISKAGGVKFDKAFWFKQSPYTEEFTPIPFNNGPVAPISNANIGKFFKGNINDPNYIESLEFNRVI